VWLQIPALGPLPLSSQTDSKQCINTTSYSVLILPSCHSLWTDLYNHLILILPFTLDLNLLFILLTSFSYCSLFIFNLISFDLLYIRWVSLLLFVLNTKLTGPQHHRKHLFHRLLHIVFNPPRSSCYITTSTSSRTTSTSLEHSPISRNTSNNEIYKAIYYQSPRSGPGNTHICAGTQLGPFLSLYQLDTCSLLTCNRSTT